MKFKSLLSDSLVYFSGNLISNLLSFISLFLIIKYSSVDDFAKYGFCVSFLSIFMFLASGGLNQYTTGNFAKEENADRLSKVFSVAFGAQGLLTLAIITCYATISFTFYGDNYFKELLILGLGALLCGLFNPVYCLWVANGHKRKVFYKDIIYSCSRFLFVILLPVGILSFEHIYYINIIGFLVILVYVLTQKIPVNWTNFYKQNMSEYAEYLKLGMPFSFLMISNILYNRADIVILESLSDSKEVALFAATTQLIYPFLFVVSALMTAAYPFFVRGFKNGFNKNDAITKVLFALFSGLVGFAIVLFLILFMPLLIELVSGDKFNGFDEVFNTLVWYILIVFTYSVFSNILIASGLVRKVLFLNIFVFFVSVFLNIITIPSGGAVAAAQNKIITELIILFFTGLGCWYALFVRAGSKKDI